MVLKLNIISKKFTRQIHNFLQEFFYNAILGRSEKIIYKNIKIFLILYFYQDQFFCK